MQAIKKTNMESKGKTEHLKSFVRRLGIDLVGIADLSTLEGMPIGIPADSATFLERFQSAIVLGAQLGKLGKQASGSEVSAYLEKAGLQVLSYLERDGYRGLIIHTEDEYDPISRTGLLSLKVLAKGAGLGWQGRSLLIVSPAYGPIHRWIAVLTDLELQADEPIANQCGTCSICVDKCPHGALTLVSFDDHPRHRENVLNLEVCRGDDGCAVCLVACPWASQHETQ
jgi:epoxyqueuosine reductase